MSLRSPAGAAALAPPAPPAAARRRASGRQDQPECKHACGENVDPLSAQGLFCGYCKACIEKTDATTSCEAFKLEADNIGTGEANKLVDDLKNGKYQKLVSLTFRNNKDGKVSASSKTLEMMVADTDTVASLKERAAALQLIPFPDQDLVLDGEVLADSRQLATCGVEDAGTLSFELVVKASEATLAKQLRDLLQARDLSCDELGLLYSYKHGVSVGQALETLGCAGEKLQDFLKKHKDFQVQNNQVALVREDTALKPFSVAAEVESILKASSTGSMEIKELCAKFVAKFNIPLSSLAGQKAADFLIQERDRFAVTGRRFVALKSAAAPRNRLQQQRPVARPGHRSGGGVPSPATAGAGAVQPPPGLEGFVTAAPSLDSLDNQQFMDLHGEICARPFQTQALQSLADVVGAVQQAVFLNVDRIVKGGSIGKGTAICGSADAELVFFLPGLPPAQHQKWLPPLLRSVAGVLSEGLGEGEDALIKDVQVVDDSVKLILRCSSPVHLRFSPVFGSYELTLQAMATQGAEARRFFGASLAAERAHFVAAQPSAVKITIRLLKWWRDRQTWTGPLTRPSDEILELVAVYSAAQSKPQEQRVAVANVMSLLARFNELRVVWSNYYSRSEIWTPLLRQRPLLMDPVNPYVNAADPSAFDPRELMRAARTTHFFD